MQSVTVVSIIILYYNIIILIVPPSYMRSVVDRNVVMRRMTLYELAQMCVKPGAVI